MCDAMLKGGFEAVLDEQMALLGQLGDASGLAILEQLSNCLLDRPSLVQFRRGTSSKLRIPVQAIMPFAGGEQRKAGKKKGGRLRSDTLRRAFNSPFWPHVLCTTSVGQEDSIFINGAAASFIGTFRATLSISNSERGGSPVTQA